MTNIAVFPLREETADESIIDDLSPEEIGARVMEREFPRMVNDLAILLAKPFRLNWDSSQPTASTDCLAEVTISPQLFLQGSRETGYGSLYHESGHINFSPYGVKLLDRAFQQGGPIMQMIMNLILDRKDDMLTAEFAPGFAENLHRRLCYISTLTRREYLKSAGKLTAEQIEVALRHWKPQDVGEDFFFAAKWHKSPRYQATHAAMKFLRRKRVLKAKPAELYHLAEIVYQILWPYLLDDKHNKINNSLVQLCLISRQVEAGNGKKISQKLINSINASLRLFISGCRSNHLKSLIQKLRLTSIHPGAISSGVTESVKVVKLKRDKENFGRYEELLADVKNQVTLLKKQLRQLDNPSEFVIHGQEEGELDLDEAARIATGLPGVYMDTILERNLDGEIHLAIDCSGSMSGEKIELAKKICVVFSEAIRTLHPYFFGHIWGFSSEAIYDCGDPGPNSSFIALKGEAGNSDTHMLKIVGSKLLASKKRRRLLLVLCDDGPDNAEEVKKLSRLLLARGVLPVHLLVGVHGTPDIYPFELLYHDMEECLKEFGDLLIQIVKNLR